MGLGTRLAGQLHPDKLLHVEPLSAQCIRLPWPFALGEEEKGRNERVPSVPLAERCARAVELDAEGRGLRGSHAKRAQQRDRLAAGQIGRGLLGADHHRRAADLEPESGVEAQRHWPLPDELALAWEECEPLRCVAEHKPALLTVARAVGLDARDGERHDLAARQPIWLDV